MHPRVGVATIVTREERVLLGRRKGSHGAGSWGFPGGHLEIGETPEACAYRELLEETGMALRNPRRGPYTNDLFSPDKHYVTLFVVGTADGEPQLLEPHKCERWDWFAWDALPQPLFLPIQHLLAEGYDPFRNP